MQVSQGTSTFKDQPGESSVKNEVQTPLETQPEVESNERPNNGTEEGKKVPLGEEEDTDDEIGT